MRWTDVPIHVIDFEGHKAYGIVEYGVVVLRGGSIADTHTRLCAPRGGIPREDTRVHGVTAESASAFPVFEEEWERFTRWRAEGPFCAHHAVFENALLKHQWAFPPHSPDFGCAGEPAAEWGPWLDTRRLAEVFFPGRERYRLGDVVAFLGLEDSLEGVARTHCPPRRTRYHCALYDALASALILLRLLEYPGYERATLPWLFDVMSGNAGGRQGELPL